MRGRPAAKEKTIEWVFDNPLSILQLAELGELY